MTTHETKICPHCRNPFYLPSHRAGEFEAHKKNCQGKTKPKPVKGPYQRNRSRIKPR